MKAVARLMLAYFTGAPLLCGITALGLAALAVGVLTLLYLPPLTTQMGAWSGYSLAQEMLFLLLPIAGMLALVFGASLLPAILARLAASHYACVLPYGRAKLLASAFGTVTLLALVAGGTTLSYYFTYPVPRLDVVFARAFFVSLLTYSLLFVVLWLAGRSRSALGVLAGAMLVIVVLALPIRFMFVPTTSLWWPISACALLWTSLAAAIVLAPRLKGALLGARDAIARRVEPESAYRGGREVDLMVGTTRPWLLCVGQIVPIGLAAYFISAPSVWLFYFTIFNALSAATTSFAATRSRPLWLRAHWTRTELFSRIEAAFWRHHSYSLGVLLVLCVAIGSYLGFPTATLGFGLALLLLGSAAIIYLGLMMTRGVTWLDALLAVGTMLLLMTTAVYAADPAAAFSTTAALEGSIAVLALGFRQLARRRWDALDWMLCRPELGVRAST